MTVLPGDERFAVEDVRTFVPAKDFAMSTAFYEALGWASIWSDDSLALMELGGYRFMLQDHYVEQWAENFMLTIVVADATAWFERASTVVADARFPGTRVSEPKQEDWGATVTYVWDPSGVLLHFTQFDR